jgi:HEAT repeat protein
MARRDVQGEIECLGRVRDMAPADASALLRKALGDRVNLVVAKAAQLIGSLGWCELIPDLLRAFDRLLEKGADRDPQCWGKNAIVKALADLDHREAAPFLLGIHCVQMEPVWGRLEDMAQDLRGRSVLALAACTDLPREDILRHIVDVMVDEAQTVRIEALRALECMEGDESALLLRLKARAGDPEPPVIGQAFDSLLKLERERALPFVTEYLRGPALETAEEAALALGISRLPEALRILREAHDSAKAELRKAILRALGTSRDEECIAFLKTVAQDGPPADAAAAREALELIGEVMPPSTPAPPPR